VDRPALGAGRHRVALVDRLAENVEQAAERLFAHRDADRSAGVDHVDATRDSVRRVHCDRAHAVVAQVLLHLRDQVDRGPLGTLRKLDSQRRVDLRQLLGEEGVDHDTLDLDDLADVLAVLLVRHASPGEVARVHCRGAVVAACQAP